MRAVIDCGTSLEFSHNTFRYLKNLLLQKYEGQALNSDMSEDSSNGEYDFDMIVIEPPIQVGAAAMGSITLNIIEYDTYPISYGVAIIYEDIENSSKNENDTLNDL